MPSTIEQLEAILNSDEELEIQILPDGSITATSIGTFSRVFKDLQGHSPIYFKLTPVKRTRLH